MEYSFTAVMLQQQLAHPAQNYIRIRAAAARDQKERSGAAHTHLLCRLECKETSCRNCV